MKIVDDEILENSLKERNELLKNPTLYGALEYAEKYNIPYVHEIALLAGLHKARLHIDFITEEEKEKSRQWLKERGFKEKLF